MKENELAEEFHEDIWKLAKEIKKTYRLTERKYAPLIDYYIETQCTDSKRIEKILDDLLGCACDVRILHLFKKLCKYYYFINKEATVFYVEAYRGMWDKSSSE